MPTKERIAKVERVLSNRQPDLHIVLEQVTNAHNASAVVRTCDAAGVLNVDLIYTASEAFPVNEAISTRAEKWLNLTHHLSTEECLLHLKQGGYTIASTHLGPESIPYTEVDYSRPMAIVFGNESAGISRAAIAAADHIIRIPMSGMAQSLNLSVSVGIILYEVLRQRRQTGFFSSLSPEEFESYKKKWLEHNHE
jgi:tRNA (guanosine-2'-O-)-methyltransferase